MFAKIICLLVPNCTSDALQSRRWRLQQAVDLVAPQPHDDSDLSDNAEGASSDEEDDFVEL